MHSANSLHKLIQLTIIIILNSNLLLTVTYLDNSMTSAQILAGWSWLLWWQWNVSEWNYLTTDIIQVVLGNMVNSDLSSGFLSTITHKKIKHYASDLICWHYNTQMEEYYQPMELGLQRAQPSEICYNWAILERSITIKFIAWCKRFNLFRPYQYYLVANTHPLPLESQSLPQSSAFPTEVHGVSTTKTNVLYVQPVVTLPHMLIIFFFIRLCYYGNLV
jgi:hypothetical protein